MGRGSSAANAVDDIRAPPATSANTDNRKCLLTWTPEWLDHGLRRMTDDDMGDILVRPELALKHAQTFLNGVRRAGTWALCEGAGRRV
jgi:hypothetical protein